MKVLHVLLGSGLGGTESLCLDLVRNLDAARFPSEVAILTGGEGPVCAELARLGVPAHLCRMERSGRFGFLIRFARLCRARGIGALVIYTYGLHPLVALAGRLGGARKVVASVGSAPPESRVARGKFALLSQLARPFVDSEVACSHYVKEQIVSAYRLPARRIPVVWNCCDLRDIAERAAAARAARRTSGPVLAMVARMDASKDHDLVIRAFARVRADFPGARLVLVGDGPRRERLAALADGLGLGSSVEFAGARRDVPGLLGRADLFVFAGRGIEGFGIVLAEAMAAGVPIICTNTGACAEVVGHGRAGVVVDATEQAFADGIAAVWRDPDWRGRLIEGGAELARERYDARVAARKFEEVLAA
jgi:glycosyltransferase involved in cell wall biosynthesis